MTSPTVRPAPGLERYQPQTVALAEQVADAVDRLSQDRRVIVVIDGPDAAGKTTLADRVAQKVARPALRASIDDWHNPREVRLPRGGESPVGYYRDSYNYEALTSQLVQPFRAGACTVQTACFDVKADAPLAVHSDVGSAAAALLLDGVFLLRPELRHHWELNIYLHVPESVTLARAVLRDAELLGGAEEVRRRYERRYLPGQAMYREAASPLDNADIVIDNSDFLRPHVVRWPDLG